MLQLTRYVPFTEFDFLRYGIEGHLDIIEAAILLSQYKMAVERAAGVDSSLERYIGYYGLFEKGLTYEILHGDLAFFCDEHKFCIAEDADGKYLQPRLCLVETDYLIDYLGSCKKFGIDPTHLKSFVYGKNALDLPMPVVSIDLPESQGCSGEVQNQFTPQDEIAKIDLRIKQALESEISAKKMADNSKWRQRLPIIEDAILWMGSVLKESHCTCSHDMLAEIAYSVGMDRNGDKFKDTDEKSENKDFRLLGKFRKLAKLLVSEERIFGLANKYKSEKCVCGINDHRKITSEIRSQRKNT